MCSSTLNIDYHVQVAHNFYSVSYQLVHEQVDVGSPSRPSKCSAKGNAWPRMRG
jgi:hypothetical protein